MLTTEESKEIPLSLRRIELNPGDALLVQVPPDILDNQALWEPLRERLQAFSQTMKVRVMVLPNDVQVTVIGSATAHALAEKVTPFERAIEELPGE